MSISLRNHEDRIVALERRVIDLAQQIQNNKPGRSITELYHGSHGGGRLTIPNVNFSDYSLIIAHVVVEPRDSWTSIFYSANLICPTYRIGGENYDCIDLTGDDAAGMFLSSNNTIDFHQWAGVWIRFVWGVK